MENEQRYQLFCDLIDELDRGVDLIDEYDAQLHDYNGTILYQAEAKILQMIGDQPGISAVECARMQKKTVSACSQIIKKLKAKGWVIQNRNPENNRVFNLFLTPEGEEIYQRHKAFETACYLRSYHLLDHFQESELKTWLEVMKYMNLGFQQDVDDSKHNFNLIHALSEA